MKYTPRQIENAKRKYNSMLRIHTLADYDLENTARNEAEQQMDHHNSIVTAIRNGNKEIEKEWKLLFLKEEVMIDQRAAESKAKLAANKEASAYILTPIKELRKLGEFGKWLNTSGNPYRKQHFNKKYTTEAVNAFLAK